MIDIVTLYAVILFLIAIVTWVIFKYIPKLLWCIPVTASIVSGSLFLRDILSINSQPTLEGKLELYFHNDWSMGFYLFYLPIFVISIMITILAYLFKHIKSKSIAKNTL
jgi:hypothetical protein